nr:SDR family oxidoreductase [Saprospiraceae bacterium]
MNIIVTGASRGIGYATCLELSKNKKHTVIALARNEAGLKKLKEEALETTGNEIRILSFDLINPRWEQLNEILSDCEQIDVLINNAGALVNKPFLVTDDEDWEKMMGVNVIRVASITRNLYKLLQASPRAHIVNISSMGGFQGSAKFAGLSAYSASKAALACLTECMAEEFSKTNIRCNCLCLGAVATEMLAEAFPGYDPPLRDYEMATYIADFSLKAHKYMNGQIIPVAFSNPG